MSLTAEQKEAIMAARGQSKAEATTGVRRYRARFADGKSATVLDMQQQPAEAIAAGVTSIFKPGYCVAVEPVNA